MARAKSAFASLTRGQRRSTSPGPISALVRGRANLARCLSRASVTRARTAWDGSPVPSPRSSCLVSRGSCTNRSIRSRNGPEMRLRYCTISWGRQRQGRSGSPKCPQGQGFMAPTRVKEAGKVTATPARTTVIRRSSRGCRRASNTLRSNSGSSSMNRTPWWANVISPGEGTPCPPPTMPA